MDSDDDIYEPNETNDDSPAKDNEMKMEDVDGDIEEGEEEEDSSDDDVNFITDAKAKLTQPEASSYKKQSQSSIEAPKASATPQPSLKAEAVTTEKASTLQPTDGRPGTDYPARHTSMLEVNGNPIHPSTSKPIQSTDFDTDFPTESSKPWRLPGSDITDFFNYGFDEFTWASYCLKQQNMPKEIKEINAQAEQMKAFVEGIPGGGPAIPASMPGMPDEATMMQMMQGMMQSGIDPSQMDPQQMMQMMMSGGGAGMAQGMGGQGGGFQAPTGPQGGYGGGGGGGGGGGVGGGGYGGGGFGARGRGRRGR